MTCGEQHLSGRNARLQLCVVVGDTANATGTTTAYINGAAAEDDLCRACQMLPATPFPPPHFPPCPPSCPSFPPFPPLLFPPSPNPSPFPSPPFFPPFPSLLSLNPFEADVIFVDVSALMYFHLQHLVRIARVYSVLS